MCSGFLLTPRFSGVLTAPEEQNRFNGFLPRDETVETVSTIGSTPNTWLKPGVNENRPAVSR
jgi:hypothetical protein